MALVVPKLIHTAPKDGSIINGYTYDHGWVTISYYKGVWRGYGFPHGIVHPIWWVNYDDTANFVLWPVVKLIRKLRHGGAIWNRS